MLFLKTNSSLCSSDGSSTISIDLATENLGILGGTGVSSAGSGNNITLAIGQAVGTSDNVTFNDLIVSGNLTVSGTTTTVNTATLNVADNIIVLNNDYTGSSPTENAGLEIERGSVANVTWLWNESTDRWTAAFPIQGEGFYSGSTQVINDSGVWVGPSTGLKGQKGQTGATGSQGDKGQKGEAGEKGQKGQFGNTGNTGPTGASGPTGSQGVKGQKGQIGDTGATGPQGSQGIQGDKGEKGTTGNKVLEKHRLGNTIGKH